MNEQTALFELQEQIAAATTEPDKETWQRLLNNAQGLHQAAIASGDEESANLGWFLAEATSCWGGYISVFKDLQHGLYYKAWCEMERIEISLMNIKNNVSGDYDKLGLSFLNSQTQAFQVLFPYTVFFSPEIIVGYELCSICRTRINPWRSCGHEIGRIYGGRLCCRLAHDIELVSISIVRKPVQKYSVGFSKDDDGNTIDQHDYATVKFVIDRLNSPLDQFSAEWIKAYHPHELFAHVSERDACPCESGIAYGECCRERPGVIRPHLQVLFEKEPPADLPTVQLAGYDGYGRVGGKLQF